MPGRDRVPARVRVSGARRLGMSQLWGDPVFGPVARELYRRCGLVFEGGQAHLFRRRVTRRAEALGFADPARYTAAFGAGLGEAEYDQLIEMLTVNETYFFREEEQFRLLVEKLFPLWRSRGAGPIRIWSAACSTGCEPYTIAMLLRERGLLGNGSQRVEILATDVNGKVLEEARRARYGEFALRCTPEYYRHKYFRRCGDLYELAPEIVRAVTFRRYNLLRPDGLTVNGGHHAVFCRNVLIYFDMEARRRAVRELTRVLRPQGVLFVGRSESLFNLPEAPPLINAGGLIYHEKP